MHIDFDNQIDSPEELAIRAQLEFYEQTKIPKALQSVKGRTEKTKYSENAKMSDNDSIISDGEVTWDFEFEDRNSITRYFYDPSLMKKRRPYLGVGTARNVHPVIDKTSPSKFKGTDLSKIRNISPMRKMKI